MRRRIAAVDGGEHAGLVAGTLANEKHSGDDDCDERRYDDRETTGIRVDLVWKTEVGDE